MKFVTISDTHGKHNDLVLPEGDVLIHAGDVSGRGLKYEITEFLKWFSAQPFEYKILIAGNHDFFFEKETEEEIKSILPENIIYLNDSGTEINGFKIWGSPITPWFLNWAFNRRRGEITKHWDLIPDDTDILVTHGPIFRTLDKTISGDHAGCKDLFLKVQKVQPKVHIFGHIHEAYGSIKKGDTTFINASVLNEKYQLVNEPVVFEL